MPSRVALSAPGSVLLVRGKTSIDAVDRLGQSCVCRVANTRWPSQRVRAIWMVSRFTHLADQDDSVLRNAERRATGNARVRAISR